MPTTDELVNRLVAEYPAIVGPPGGRGPAVTWFREAWPHLDAVHREPPGSAWTVAVAVMLVPFLVEIEDWAGLCEVAGRGLAANPEEEDTAVRLRRALAAGLQRSGRYAEARVILEGLLERATAAGDEGARGAVIAHLGQIARAEGDRRAAARDYQRAIRAYRTAGNDTGEARSCSDLATLLAEAGDLNEAVRYATRAVDLWRAAGDRGRTADALTRRAELQGAAGRTAEALADLAAAADLYRADGAPADAVRALRDRARMQLVAGMSAAALETAAAAADLARELDVDPTGPAEVAELAAVSVAVDDLLAAPTDEARVAVIAACGQVLRGPLAWFLLTRRRDEGDPGAGRCLAVLGRDPLAYQGGVARAFRAEMCALAGVPETDLPPAALAALDALAVTDLPHEQVEAATAVLDGLASGVGDPLRGMVSLLLAQALVALPGAGPEEVERALAAGAVAAELLSGPAHRERWAAVQTFLGTTWRTREAGDPRVNVERALAAFRAALSVYRSDTHPAERAATLGSLANAYWRRRGEGTRDLRRALVRHEAALRLLEPTATEERALTLSNIGLILTDPMLAGDVSSAERGYRHLLRAADAVVRPAGRAAVLNNLARYLPRREIGDPEENLDNALMYARQSYELAGETGSVLDRAESANGLGDILGTIALRRGEDPVAAVEWFQRTLDLVGEDTAPRLWAGAADNLANTLVQRPEPTAADLARALALHEDALRVFDRIGDGPAVARTLHNIAGTLGRTSPPDPDRAIPCLERALEIRTADVLPVERLESTTELARHLLQRGGPADVERAVDLLVETLDATSAVGAIGHRRRAADLLGSAHADRGRWVEAAAAYDVALDAAELRYRAGILPTGREAELFQAADLPREAAFAHARAGDPRRAVAVIEAARARELGERLARDRADLAVLEETRPDLAAAHREAAGRVREVEARLRLGGREPGDVRTLRAALTDATARLDAVHQAIAEIPGHEAGGGIVPDGLDALSSALAAARPGTPLAYLLPCRLGILSLVVSADGPDGPHVEIVEAESGGRLPEWPGDPNMVDVLGALVAGPLAAALARRGSSAVVLVPTGILGLLPVQAGRYGSPPRHLVEEFTVSFAPSARVLLAARAEADRLTGAAPRLLGVGEPLPSEPPLPWASAEVEAVAAIVRSAGGTAAVLSGAEASVPAVLDAARSATHVHLACHGSYAPDDPLESALHLAGGARLTLRELLGGRPLAGTRLVVASACESAVTDMNRLPEESVGLPAGLVQAGAAAVVGTLWPVSDFAAAVIVTRFHRELFDGTEPVPPAEALRRAQRWLLRADAADVARFVQDTGLRRRPRANGSAARGGGAVGLEQWCAFVLVGAG